VHVYYILRFAEWAIAVRQGDYKAFDRTLDRRAIRDVLLRLWDFLCKDQHFLTQHRDNGPLAAWMIEVLRTVLPMERADCLFNMRYNDSGLFGMPWISKLHVGTAQHREWQTWIHDRWGGQPAMNRRFVEMVAHLKKHLDEYDYNRDDMKLIERLLVPTMPDGLPMDMSLLFDDGDSQYYTANRRADRASQREKVHAATAGTYAIQDFTAIYKSTAYMKHVNVLHTLSNDQNLYKFADEWAAYHMRRGDAEADDAEELDDEVQDEEEDETAVVSEDYNALDEFVPADLRMILCFYEKLSSCLQDVDNHSVTHDSVVAQFKIQSLTNVLGIALALGRSWAVATNHSWPASWMDDLCKHHAFTEDEPNLQNLHFWLIKYVPRP
jgi:hypothetical protein